MSPRVKTGSAAIDRQIEALLDECGATEDRDLLFDIIASGVLLAGDDSDRLDLKITAATLAEMRMAFNVFAPYHDQPKVTIFGSARILADDPLYLSARDACGALGRRGLDGRHRRRPRHHGGRPRGGRTREAFGVNIRLPFEQEANEFIARRPQARVHEVLLHPQAELVKESQGFALPSRWLRDPRRDLRAAHPPADRQVGADPDRLPRRAGRHLLGGLRAASPSTTWRPAATSPRKTSAS